MVFFKTSCLWSLLKFEKSFAFIGCLGVLTKIKKGYGTSRIRRANRIRMFLVQTPLGTQLSFGCPRANFEPLLKAEPHYLDANHCVFYIFDSKVPRRFVTTQPQVKAGLNFIIFSGN